jgi:peptidoglycan/LPS O-acetylase OafA/YrhL
MTIGRARSTIAIVWSIGVAPMFIMLIAMTLFGRFDKDWDTPWNWFLPLTCPILGVIITALTIKEHEAHSHQIKSPHVFWLGLAVSVLYLLSIYAIVLVQPFTDQSLEKLMRSSGWYLGIVQGFASAFVGKFFVENV